MSVMRCDKRQRSVSNGLMYCVPLALPVRRICRKHWQSQWHTSIHEGLDGISNVEQGTLNDEGKTGHFDVRCSLFGVRCSVFDIDKAIAQAHHVCDAVCLRVACHTLQGTQPPMNIDRTVLR